jgi:transposase-like protein
MEEGIDTFLLTSQPFSEGFCDIERGLNCSNPRETPFTRYLGELLIEQSDKYGVEATCNLYRLPQTLLQRLPTIVPRVVVVERHQQEQDSSPFVHMCFSPEFKKRIIDMVVDERKTPNEITKITGVSCSSVQFWLKKYQTNEPLKETVSTSERTSRVLVEAYRRLEGRRDNAK